MEIVIDTHTLAWNLTDPKKLSKEAANVLVNAKLIYVPVIVLLELERVLKKSNYLDKLAELPSLLQTKQKYQVYPLDKQVFDEYLLVDDSLEMHDRVIVATAKLLNLPIVTRDQRISEIYHNVIW